MSIRLVDGLQVDLRVVAIADGKILEFVRIVFQIVKLFPFAGSQVADVLALGQRYVLYQGQSL